MLYTCRIPYTDLYIRPHCCWIEKLSEVLKLHTSPRPACIRSMHFLQEYGLIIRKGFVILHWDSTVYLKRHKHISQFAPIYLKAVITNRKILWQASSLLTPLHLFYTVRDTILALCYFLLSQLFPHCLPHWLCQHTKLLPHQC